MAWGAFIQHSIRAIMIKLSSVARTSLLIFAIIAFLGPNGMFLYFNIVEPDLIQQANANPVALAFMIEAMMLLGLFLVYIWLKTKSASQVVLYVVLSFAGSLAFSFALYLYLNSRPSEPA